ncbi:MAG: hypothetical protein ACNYWM_12965 [Methanosarcinales archaeon]
MFILLAQKVVLGAVPVPDLSSPVTITMLPFSIPSTLTAGLYIWSSSTIMSYHTSVDFS